MLIYGYYFRRLFTERFRTSDGMNINLVISCKLYHVMFIPFVAGEKVAYVEIEENPEHKYSPESFGLSNDAEKLLEQQSKPWYGYIGLILVALFILMIAIGIYTDKKQKKADFHTSIENLYETQTIIYKNNNKTYTYCLVDSVDEKNVWVYESENKSKRASHVSYEYTGGAKLYTRQQFKDLADNELLVSIDDNSNACLLRGIDYGAIQECVLYYFIDKDQYSSMLVDSISHSSNIVYLRKNKLIANTLDNAIKLNVPENYSDSTITMKYKNLDRLFSLGIIESLHIN